MIDAGGLPALGIPATALFGAPGTVSAGIGFSTDWNRLTLVLAAGMHVAVQRIKPVTTSG